MPSHSELATEDKPITVVRAFLKAWAAGDFERVVDLFAGEAVFSASVGSEPGRTLRGREEIAPAVKIMLASGEGTQFSITEMLPILDGAVVTWTQTGETKDGQSLNIKGIDIFKVKDGAIVLKNAYRKVAL